MDRSEKYAQICENCGKRYDEHIKNAMGRFCQTAMFSAAPREEPARQPPADLNAAIDQLRARWRDPNCTGWTCPMCGRKVNYKLDTECDECGFDAAPYGEKPAPPPPPRCDHKFVDSKPCLKCGWVPPAALPEAPRAEEQP